MLALEGNPGIGKTTAVIKHLTAQSDGFLFIYVSPRIIINDDVTEKLARDEQTRQPTGVLTVTTNARIIGTASNWYEQQVADGTASKRRVDSAVVVDGVEHLVEPPGSTLILRPEQRAMIEEAHTDANFQKWAESDRQDRIVNKKQPGVLKVLASTTHGLLQRNQSVNRVVLTAAIQGYRDLGSGTSTLQALGNLFESGTDTRAGRSERAAFARRVPTVVVMVDELTGDGAGALFVEKAAELLEAQCLEPFEDDPRFTVVLIISDASLGNDVVLDSYLRSGDGAPDKVLVSKSAGTRAFRLAARPLRLAGRSRPTLHVMANSYPARNLHVEYRLRMEMVSPEQTPAGDEQTVRQAIAKQKGDALLDQAWREIARALAAGPDGPGASQVIFFAQDKAFLKQVAPWSRKRGAV